MTQSNLNKFIVVGMLATAIHIAIASCLIEYCSHQSPGLANIFAFLGATFFSYVGNTKWSFAKQFSRRNAIRFFGTASAGSIIAYTLSSIAHALGCHYLVGIAVVVICIPILSFLVHSRWTYKND